MVGNSAFRTGEDVEAPELVARAESFFGRLGRGFTVKVRDDGSDEDLRAAALHAGLETFGEGAPQMLVRTPLDDPPSVEGVELRAVDDAVGVHAFVEVNGAAYATYGMPAGVHADLFDRPDAVLDDPAVHLVVAWRGSDPVAAALVYESDGVASVQWVGTVPHERGRGLAALVTTWTTNVAFDRGASSCTLQASPWASRSTGGSGTRRSTATRIWCAGRRRARAEPAPTPRRSPAAPTAPGRTPVRPVSAGEARARRPPGRHAGGSRRRCLSDARRG